MLPPAPPQGRAIFIVSADVNIAHKEADLKTGKATKRIPVSCPRSAWMTRLTQEEAIVDTYRALHPDTTDECYTWWSNRARPGRRTGWRLDYQLATPDLASGAGGQRPQGRALLRITRH